MGSRVTLLRNCSLRCKPLQSSSTGAGNQISLSFESPFSPSAGVSKSPGLPGLVGYPDPPKLAPPANKSSPQAVKRPPVKMKLMDIINFV